MCRLEERQGAAFRIRALGDDDDAELGPPSIAFAQSLDDQGYVEWDFWDQNSVRAPGHTRIERDPPRVAPHHFDNKNALVRLGRRMQPVDGIGREVDGRV